MSWPIAALRRYGVNNVSLTIVTGRYGIASLLASGDVCAPAGTVQLVKASSSSLPSRAGECTATSTPWPSVEQLPKHIHCTGQGQGSVATLLV